MFTPGDKIVVRSTDSRRDGFVSNFGRFLRYKVDANGENYAIEYDWHGMTAFRFLDRITVAAYTGRAFDDAAGLVAA